MHRTQRCFLTSGCSTYCRVRLRALRGPAGAPSAIRCERHGPGFEAPQRPRCHPSPRSGNEEGGAMPPQPHGPMGVAADLFVACRRRCSGIDFLLAPRHRLTSPIGGRHWGLPPDLWVENLTGHGTSPTSPRKLVKYVSEFGGMIPEKKATNSVRRGWCPVEAFGSASQLHGESRPRIGRRRRLRHGR
jgi:hypothetical protein